MRRYVLSTSAVLSASLTVAYAASITLDVAADFNNASVETNINRTAGRLRVNVIDNRDAADTWFRLPYDGGSTWGMELQKSTAAAYLGPDVCLLDDDNNFGTIEVFDGQRYRVGPRTESGSVTSVQPGIDIELPAGNLVSEIRFVTHGARTVNPTTPADASYDVTITLADTTVLTASIPIAPADVTGSARDASGTSGGLSWQVTALPTGTLLSDTDNDECLGDEGDQVVLTLVDAEIDTIRFDYPDAGAPNAQDAYLGGPIALSTDGDEAAIQAGFTWRATYVSSDQVSTAIGGTNAIWYEVDWDIQTVADATDVDLYVRCGTDGGDGTLAGADWQASDTGDTGDDAWQGPIRMATATPPIRFDDCTGEHLQYRVEFYPEWDQNPAVESLTFTFNPDADDDGFPAEAVAGHPQVDCDDTDPLINPDADEICDGVDNDCANGTDDDDPNVIDQDTWYRDVDSDDFGDPLNSVLACEQPAGFVADNNDCDDNRSDVNPDADEVCDNVDNTCNGDIDDDDANVIGQGTWYRDVDGDGFGDPSNSVQACFQPPGYVADNTDCDDTRFSVNPGADEICDDLDNDCDGDIDDDDNDVIGRATWYRDVDGDLYGNPTNTLLSCEQPAGYVPDNTDCDDTRANVNPGEDEVCDGLDNDCDNDIDDDDDDVIGQATWYRDQDNDSFGNPTNTTLRCALPAGYVADNTDCDDTNPLINPTATVNLTHVGDGIDQNCTLQDECLTDADNDTYGTTPIIPGVGGVANRCNGANVAFHQPLLGFDCDDTRSDVYPGKPVTQADIANGRDNTCDGTDECWRDNDEDGFGDDAAIYVPDIGFNGCNANQRESANANDCDDNDEDIFPNAPVDLSHVGDGVDQNCSTHDECLRDDDDDLFGVNDIIAGVGPASNRCDGANVAYHQPSLGFDCDDANDTIYPEAPVNLTHVGDGIDQNCTLQDECLTDADNDTYGTTPIIPGVGGVANRCNGANVAFHQPSLGFDCDDTRTDVYPDKPVTQIDIDNGRDNNCDGTDECWADDDRDGYGDVAAIYVPDSGFDGCQASQRESGNADDCDDEVETINPGMNDRCDGPAPRFGGNGIDNDCDGYTGDDEAVGGGSLGDGLAWVDEVIFNTSDCAVDTDGDTLTDLFEFNYDCGPGVQIRGDAADTDNDGIRDDAEVTTGDTDGDGIMDACDDDDDGDGIPSWEEIGDPLNPTDSDGDGIPDFLDDDDDNDGVPTRLEIAFDSADNWVPVDTDGDGIDDHLDEDDDGDDVPTINELSTTVDGDGWRVFLDTDDNGVPNHRDPDDDGDTVLTRLELSSTIGPDGWRVFWQTDSDGIPDHLDEDDDNDEILTADERAQGPGESDDQDGDGLNNWRDLDSDNDGWSDTREWHEVAPGSAGDRDSDDDGVRDFLDTDSDNDHVLDEDELDANTDNSGGDNRVDPDDDGDGIPTRQEYDDASWGPAGFNGFTQKDDDTDGDGTPNYLDLDSDGDGWSDEREWDEVAPGASNRDSDADGIRDFQDRDSDNDSVPDAQEVDGNSDGDSLANRVDPDDDGDGLPTASELHPTQTVSIGGQQWPAVIDRFTSSPDGHVEDDCVAQLRTVANTPVLVGTQTNPNGACPDYLDPDDDDDNVPTSAEHPFGNTDGDSQPDHLDRDDDNDSVPTRLEYPQGAPDDGLCAGDTRGTDAFGLGTPDHRNPDDDGDGIPTAVELTFLQDLDLDGHCNHRDLDADNDGFVDSLEMDIDSDLDGLPDFVDCDSDNDTVPDAAERNANTDGDGLVDRLDDDDDGDGIPTRFEDYPCNPTAPDDCEYTENTVTPAQTSDCRSGVQFLLGPSRNDWDGDSQANYLDNDDDGDDVPTIDEAPSVQATTVSGQDFDGDGWPDFLDTDDDNDGIPTRLEIPCGTTPSFGAPASHNLDGLGSPGTAGDWGPNYLDIDDDNDGIPSLEEETGYPSVGNDVDGDNCRNAFDLDSDGDGFADQYEYVDPFDPSATSFDFDNDGIPDFLDVDSDGDGVPDATELSPYEGTALTGAAGVWDFATFTNGRWLTFPPDSDGDGVEDRLDVDDDGDGIPTFWERYSCADGDDGSGLAATVRADMQLVGPLGVCVDAAEGTSPHGFDWDGDDIPNYLDTDDDNDNVPTFDEDYIYDYVLELEDHDGLPTTPDVAVIDPGIRPKLPGERPEPTDGFPARSDTDGDGVPDFLDVDDDGDGLATALEYLDPFQTYAAEPHRLFVYDPATLVPQPFNSNPQGNRDDLLNVHPAEFGDNLPDYLDSDDDGDGILTIDEDTDGDGDPRNDNLNTDPETLDPPQARGLDRAIACFPANPNAWPADDTWKQMSIGCYDYLPDYLDVDDDGDGVPTWAERAEQIAAQSICDPADEASCWDRNTDIDNDSILDGREFLNILVLGDPSIPQNAWEFNWLTIEQWSGVADYPLCAGRDIDTDGDYVPDSLNGRYWFEPWDRDCDDVPNYRDTDDDGDELPTIQEGRGDVDCLTGTESVVGDGIPNYLDYDADNGTSIYDIDVHGCTPAEAAGDGGTDDIRCERRVDREPLAPNWGGEGVTLDWDGDGIPDAYDCIDDGPFGDSDNDGVLNSVEDELCAYWQPFRGNDVQTWPRTAEGAALAAGYVTGYVADCGTNPILTQVGCRDTPDSDCDGVPDCQEAGFIQIDPLTGQSLGPAVDACNLESNELQLDPNQLRDTDADGIPDIFDPDDDNDRVSTSEELVFECPPGEVSRPTDLFYNEFDQDCCYDPNRTNANCPDLAAGACAGIDVPTQTPFDAGRYIWFCRDAQGIRTGNVVGITTNAPWSRNTDAPGGSGGPSTGACAMVAPFPLFGDDVPDYLDEDDDGDGRITRIEVGPMDPDAPELTETVRAIYEGDALHPFIGPYFRDPFADQDGDSCPNYLDPFDGDGPASDPDGDGIPTEVELSLGMSPYSSDTDGDGVPDNVELANALSANYDSDGDGVIDPLDTDDDDDGIPTMVEGLGDQDRDGIPNYLDTDSDGDGIDDADEFDGLPARDSDCDGLPDFLDTTDDSAVFCEQPPPPPPPAEGCQGCSSSSGSGGLLGLLGLFTLGLARRRR